MEQSTVVHAFWRIRSEDGFVKEDRSVKELWITTDEPASNATRWNYAPGSDSADNTLNKEACAGVLYRCRVMHPEMKFVVEAVLETVVTSTQSRVMDEPKFLGGA